MTHECKYKTALRAQMGLCDFHGCDELRVGFVSTGTKGLLYCPAHRDAMFAKAEPLRAAYEREQVPWRVACEECGHPRHAHSDKGRNYCNEADAIEGSCDCPLFVLPDGEPDLPKEPRHGG